MQQLSFYLMFDIITVFVLAFFTLFLLVSPKKARLSNLLLAGFMASVALAYMDGVYIRLGTHFHHNYHYIVHATMSFDYLIGPFLLLYIMSCIRKDFMLKPVYLLHSVFFWVHLMFLVSRPVAGPLDEGAPANAYFSTSEIIALTTISNLHFLLYILVVLATLVRYRRQVRNLYANVVDRDFSWLILLSVGLLAAGLLRFANNLLWLQVPETAYSLPVDLKIFGILLIFTFACTLLYKSLRNPEVLQLEPVQALGGQKEKYRTTLLPESVKREYVELITRHMREQKPFLDANLGLTTLARQLDLPAHHVSQILNAEFKQNFFDFVNAYRIEEAKRLLHSVDAQGKTITQIMYDIGFNSKSVFNTAFKKLTGLTPSAYRKAQLSA